MGKVFRFHKDVDTDQIIASQYLLFPTIDEMKVEKGFGQNYFYCFDGEKMEKLWNLQKRYLYLFFY